MMDNDEKKLDELYVMLDVMENNLPDEEIKSKEIIDNLKELNEEEHTYKSVDVEIKIEEIPEGIINALSNLKKIIKLLNLDIEDEKVKQFKLLDLNIDEFINLFGKLQEEKDLNKRTELTDKIRDKYQEIKTFLPK